MVVVADDGGETCTSQRVEDGVPAPTCASFSVVLAAVSFGSEVLPIVTTSSRPTFVSRYVTPQ